MFFRRFTQTVILGITFMYVTTIALIFEEPIIKYTFRPLMVNSMCIKSIDGTKSEVKIVKKCLDNFNKLGHNRIVKYCPVGKYDIPIYIKVEKFTRLDWLDYAGVSYNFFSEGRIYLNSDGIKDLVGFEETTIHELLHLYGYNHVPQRDDIMYESGTYLNKEKSKLRYAKELEEALYE